MEISKANKHQPTCLLSHYFINKLTVIIGSCQILQEKAERSGGFYTECTRRLSVIEEVAKGIVDELNDHECRLDAMRKVAVMANPAASIHSKKALAFPPNRIQGPPGAGLILGANAPSSP
jgi:hypothetical protein